MDNSYRNIYLLDHKNAANIVTTTINVIPTDIRKVNAFHVDIAKLKDFKLKGLKF